MTSKVKLTPQPLVVSVAPVLVKSGSHYFDVSAFEASSAASDERNRHFEMHFITVVGTLRVDAETNLPGNIDLQRFIHGSLLGVTRVRHIFA